MQRKPTHGEPGSGEICACLLTAAAKWRPRARLSPARLLPRSKQRMLLDMLDAAISSTNAQAA